MHRRCQEKFIKKPTGSNNLLLRSCHFHEYHEYVQSAGTGPSLERFYKIRFSLPPVGGIWAILSTSLNSIQNNFARVHGGATSASEASPLVKNHRVSMMPRCKKWMGRVVITPGTVADRHGRTYVMHMRNICATQVKTYVRRIWDIRETYAKHIWHINVIWNWIALCLCFTYVQVCKFMCFLYVGGEKKLCKSRKLLEASKLGGYKTNP